ncbi:MAG TPA: OsmC family protein [Steroidobacteraceae bacterium]|nr:OsmC family protein [Steroidobacteraceae bacterium]
MHPYPHRYEVGAQGTAAGLVAVTAAGLPALDTAAPPEFDGPGGVWSPECLLVAAIADCFILTFRSIARAGHFEWTRLHCEVQGVLERVSGVAQFTRFTSRARLAAPPGVDRDKARELLERAEKLCLVSNSLRGERLLEIEIVED